MRIVNVVVALCVAVLAFCPNLSRADEPIDREALVGRHRLETTDFEIMYPIGNGEFCVNVDGSGLQTICGSTFAHWGWHESPLPTGFSQADVSPTGTYQTHRNEGPDALPADKEGLHGWLYANPHQLNLGRLRFLRSGATSIVPDDLTQLSRSLDLWTGIHRSSFQFEGQPVTVTTAVGDRDELSVSIDSPLLEEERLCLSLDFPWMGTNGGQLVGEEQRGGFMPGGWAGDFSCPANHRTTFLRQEEKDATSHAVLLRTADNLRYYVTLKGVNLHLEYDETKNPHEILLTPTAGHCELTLLFEPVAEQFPESAVEDETKLSAVGQACEDFQTVCEASRSRWQHFWLSGGVVDFSGSSDPRAAELERRVVLSQFLMRTNSAGSWPSAEPGLLDMDGWCGRFHMEMVWWHLAHYYLWGRSELADEAISCYQRLLPAAEALAGQLGYAGAMWPKAVGPDGRSQWWTGNLCLLWKQPHPIFFAELEYRLRPTRATLEKWSEVIEKTADFMADYPKKDGEGVYHLDPVMPPGELGVTRDTSFDLTYWRFGLRQANVWRERLGRPENESWREVEEHLAPLPIQDNYYVHSEEWRDSFAARNWEHPDLIGFFGMLPRSSDVDFETGKRTVERVVEQWQWERCWGWDFPWMAMAAAKAGRGDLAVEMLLHPSSRNAYDPRGVCQGGPCPYLPGNGGLLYAVALMAAGWDGAPEGPMPGFPQDGRWHVRWEGLSPAP
ncbi:MAG: hypothetical protein Q4G68_08965 [Planctomycetia bacterium]|nr:hypothetical protein [Planctomycetia bacterium]